MIDKNCISTFYGNTFDPTNPQAENIDLRDIAHALSLLSRANGHFRVFYSVGRHSLNCAYEAKARGASAKVQLCALLHDSAECYIGDLTRPLRRHIPQFTEYERRLQKLIFEKYATVNITPEEAQMIRAIDNSLLYYEFLAFHGAKLTVEDVTPLHIELCEAPDDPAVTEAEFLSVYAELRQAFLQENSAKTVEN